MFRGYGRQSMATAPRERLARALRGDAMPAFSVEVTPR
jgi:hypothetical protein